MCADRTRFRDPGQGAQRGERLQKVLAQAGVAARRKCEEYILAGRVKVNGRVVTELGTRVHPDADLVEFDGAPVVARERKYQYYLLYKPAGYLSTVSDPRGRPTALSLVPSEERLYPVGRLDLDSEGLLLFTNDGDLAYRLIHPRFAHEKEYLVLVRGEPTEEALGRLRQGVHIGEGRVFVRAQAERIAPGTRLRPGPAPAGYTWLRVVLREGQKRQIRYMLEAVGYDVERLIRVRMGDLELGGIEPGRGRWLSREEAKALRRLVGLEREPGKQARPDKRGEQIEQDHRGHRRPSRGGQEHRGRRPRP